MEGQNKSKLLKVRTEITNQYGTFDIYAHGQKKAMPVGVIKFGQKSTEAGPHLLPQTKRSIIKTNKRN